MAVGQKQSKLCQELKKSMAIEVQLIYEENSRDFWNYIEKSSPEGGCCSKAIETCELCKKIKTMEIRFEYVKMWGNFEIIFKNHHQNTIIL